MDQAPNPGPWSETITVLTANLRDALSALAKVAARAHISWRDGEAYDDWDDLASRVYEVLVGRPIAADEDAGPGVLPLAPYDMRLPNYADHSSLVTQHNGSTLFFNKLLAGGGDFAAAEALSVTLDGQPLDVAPTFLPLTSVSWVLLQRRSDGSTEIRDHIVVSR